MLHLTSIEEKEIVVDSFEQQIKELQEHVDIVLDYYKMQWLKKVKVIHH
jgi:hypothetical protein